jgi:ribosomal-protein-alanine N-acetyltransferase
MPRNEKSAKLLKRLNFTIEGYARDYLFIDGKWEDHILTSLTNVSSEL